MAIKLSREATKLIESQSGAIARRQAALAGVSPETVRNSNRSGRWQRRYWGTYLAFSGAGSRKADLEAALLRAGPGATLSHQTAAERHGLLDEPSDAIHITVPAERHPARRNKIPGVVIHRSNSLSRTRHPALKPACTRVEDTVLDLIENSRTFGEAYVWLCRAVGRRRTTAERILAAMARRKKMRWRARVAAALGEVAGGALSILEHRYVQRVERPHGLPAATRQARKQQQTGNKYLDNLYQDYGVCVEIDGTAAHPADEQWRDKRRDNWNLVHANVVTLRFGLLDLDDGNQCQTARDVADRLRLSGWTGTPHPCRNPACVLRHAP